jgi:hypothetical protein
MPQSRTIYVGMDGHNESIAVASVAQEHGAAVVSLGTVGTRQGDIDKLSGSCRRRACRSSSSTQPAPATPGSLAP